MFGFAIGMLIGSMVGVVITCLCVQAGSERTEEDGREQADYLKKWRDRHDSK